MMVFYKGLDPKWWCLVSTTIPMEVLTLLFCLNTIRDHICRVRSIFEHVALAVFMYLLCLPMAPPAGWRPLPSDREWCHVFRSFKWRYSRARHIAGTPFAYLIGLPNRFNDPPMRRLAFAAPMAWHLPMHPQAHLVTWYSFWHRETIPAHWFDFRATRYHPPNRCYGLRFPQFRVFKPKNLAWASRTDHKRRQKTSSDHGCGATMDAGGHAPSHRRGWMASQSPRFEVDVYRFRT